MGSIVLVIKLCWSVITIKAIHMDIKTEAYVVKRSAQGLVNRTISLIPEIYLHFHIRLNKIVF